MKREPRDRGGDTPAPQRRSEAVGVFVRPRYAQGAVEADEKGLKMTVAFGFRTCALALCLVMTVHAQPVPDTTQCADSLPPWNDVCSLSVHGATVRWAVGDSGKVFRTVDGDTAAEYVLGRGQYDLCGVSFADENHGWIVGYKRGDPDRGSGVVLSTRRGGNVVRDWFWSCPVVRPNVNVPFVEVRALSPRHVWVTCGDGYMLYSNDARANWSATARRGGSGEPGTTGSGHER